jgi:hypothetical protein
MADYICHGCNQRKAQNHVRECTKCGKILCDVCRKNEVYCKNSAKGTAGCAGTLKSK